MTTTPLMGLVLPVDHGSNDVWAPILQTLFDRVDLHNHTTGLGAKVPTGGLNIDADLSFSPSGTPRAITDLKAIDFSAVAASAVASLAGAFFLSDGTGGLVVNELYYRTTSGSNVRITSGAALNVAAFAGAIGGDYVSVGALIDYDDASDMYRFRQETAAAVRQFAKVQFADIILTEYDPSGDASVPTNAITIKSPDALAASYSVIWPAAVPGSTSYLTMTSAGVLATTSKSQSMMIPIVDVLPAAGVTLSNAGLVFGTVALQNYFPVNLPIGSVITAFTVWLRKTSASGLIAAQFDDLNGTSGVVTTLGTPAGNSANNPGFITLTDSTLNVTVTAGHSYTVTFSGGGVTGDTAYACRVVYVDP